MTLNPTDPQEGLYFDVPEKVYRQAKGWSQSDLKECEYSMAHCKEAKFGPKKKSSAAQITGTLLHGLALQKRELWAVVPEDAPNKPTKAQLNAVKKSPATVEAIAWWAAFRNRHANKEFISAKEADELYRMRDAILADEDAAEMLGRTNHFEVASFKRHEATGLMMKGLADALTVDDNERTTIPDIKTTQKGGASYDEFQRDLLKWGYHRQAAFYIDLFGASFFVFICVEKEPPYAVACYEPDSELLRIGRAANERDLMRIAECEKTGIWPGYTKGIRKIGWPENWRKPI